MKNILANYNKESVKNMYLKLLKKLLVSIIVLSLFPVYISTAESHLVTIIVSDEKIISAKQTQVLNSSVYDQMWDDTGESTFSRSIVASEHGLVNNAAMVDGISHGKAESVTLNHADYIGVDQIKITFLYKTAPVVTDPPVTDPPVTDPPETNPPETDSPATDPPVTDSPVTDPPVTDPPVTDSPASQPPEDIPTNDVTDNPTNPPESNYTNPPENQPTNKPTVIPEESQIVLSETDPPVFTNPPVVTDAPVVVVEMQTDPLVIETIAPTDPPTNIQIITPYIEQTTQPTPAPTKQAKSKQKKAKVTNTPLATQMPNLTPSVLSETDIQKPRPKKAKEAFEVTIQYFSDSFTGEHHLIAADDYFYAVIPYIDTAGCLLFVASGEMTIEIYFDENDKNANIDYSWLNEYDNILVTQTFADKVIQRSSFIGNSLQFYYFSTREELDAILSLFK